jgi:predicted nucleic acid-binding protein
LPKELPNVARLLARYRSVPMSLADACLVRMAEQHAASVVLTLDRHFTVYRKSGRLAIPTLMP